MKTQMTSAKGNKVANQYIDNDTIANINGTILNGSMFQSYDSNIVFIDDEGQTYLDETYWNFSVTTSKYRIRFLDETTKETAKKIDSGEYVLVNLN